MDGSLRKAVDASWAEALGCDARRVRSPGIHLVREGPGFEGYKRRLLARVDEAVLVYRPESLRAVAREAFDDDRAGVTFTSRTLERIASGA